ncbi:hypothetical protein [Bilophila wadsworthia]|uniref:hypothetical protein n=1 Tax=Bilophila wadsworthia TaxID=35833 RepID=UPI00351FF820
MGEWNWRGEGNLSGERFPSPPPNLPPPFQRLSTLSNPSCRVFGRKKASLCWGSFFILKKKEDGSSSSSLCGFPAPLRHLKDHLSKEGLLPIGKTEDRDSIRSKVFGGEGEGFGEGKRGLSPESPLFPSPIFPPRTKEQRPGGGDGALQRKEEDTVSVRRRMTLPLNEQTQLGTCETVRWNRSFKVVEALVYVNGFADYCFP